MEMESRNKITAQSKDVEDRRMRNYFIALMGPRNWLITWGDGPALMTGSDPGVGSRKLRLWGTIVLYSFP